VTRPSRREFLKAAALVTGGAFAGTRLAVGAEASPRRVLWAANVRSKPFAERLESAAEHGFTHMSMFPIDYRSLLEGGQTPADIRRAIEASGVEVLVCDPFTQWVPRWELPDGYPDDCVAFVNFDEDFIFGMAETTGASVVNCVEPFGVPYETDELVDAMGAFAERAARNGLRVAHEFMPISGIPDLKSGWAVVEPQDPALVGLTFDTWHFFRSDPDTELLASIPGDRIFEVKLADALNELQGGDLTTDLLQYRRQPGDGEFDLDAVVSILKRNGAWRSVGPEVFAAEMDSLTTDAAVEKAASALVRFVE